MKGNNILEQQFTWIEIYSRIAYQLLTWKDRQRELIALLEEFRANGVVITPLMDQDDQGARFLLTEIDPFTFFGTFNRGIRIEQRIAIIAGIMKKFDLEGSAPTDFDGLPLLNNQRSWFFTYKSERKPDDVERLWQVFKLALGDKPLDSPDFLKAFDEALSVKCTNLNLTMGLFWIRPDTFLNLDQTNRKFLDTKLPPSGLSAEFYKKIVLEALSKGKSLPQLSHEAWLQATQPIVTPIVLPEENNFWMVGAYWSDNDPPDLTQRFLDEGIWQNGYENKYLDEVRSMRVGDKIAIKATSTQRLGLPFDCRGKTVSRMTIKATGTIVANRGDGRTVEVEWDPTFKPKDWYFYTYQRAVWRLRREDKFARQLIDFAFNNAEQDYPFFVQQWWRADGDQDPAPYGIEDLLASGVFLTETELRQALERLESKKNLILQGPPGVGKTFIARKLAYALMEARDDERIEMVQFHQSYSYEDFVRGYRPLPEKAGTFGLQDGIFFSFCALAKADPDRPYVFIIDEINRGNLSQIFGELLMLIEADKRGTEYSVPLVFRNPDETRFYVPKNLYLIGLMNVADRSLAIVDYALRRRFAFMTLKPQYESKIFRDWLRERNMHADLINLIIERMVSLNREISEDPLLGENYQLGHSFFCPKGDNFSGLDRNWYEGIVHCEVIPLLQEYWFDNPNRAGQARDRLIAP